MPAGSASQFEWRCTGREWHCTPPFIPAFADELPLPLIQPSARRACRRLARIDLPAPGPPHIKKKNETSWNGSKACNLCTDNER